MAASPQGRPVDGFGRAQKVIGRARKIERRPIPDPFRAFSARSQIPCSPSPTQWELQEVWGGDWRLLRRFTPSDSSFPPSTYFQSMRRPFSSLAIPSSRCKVVWCSAMRRFSVRATSVQCLARALRHLKGLLRRGEFGPRRMSAFDHASTVFHHLLRWSCWPSLPTRTSFTRSSNTSNCPPPRRRCCRTVAPSRNSTSAWTSSPQTTASTPITSAQGKTAANGLGQQGHFP